MSTDIYIFFYLNYVVAETMRKTDCNTYLSEEQKTNRSLLVSVI